MENPIRMDDLGVPLFLETFMCRQLTLYFLLYNIDMSGGFYLLCGPSKDDVGSPPRLVLVSFLRFWDFSTMIGLVFQFWKVGQQQALSLL